MKDQDSIFFKNFSLMLGGLILLTIILAVVSNIMNNNILGDDVLAKDRTAIVNAIVPVAKVNTGEVITAAQETSEVAAIEPIADASATDPAQIYQTVCFVCHGAGIAGAPKLETAAWAGRLETGLDKLTANAINGIGVMPPKGGRVDLSDETIKAVVEFMIKDL